MHRLQTEWLVNNHLPHHVTQSEEFRAMMTELDPQFKPISRDKFNHEVDDMFHAMCLTIQEVTDANRITVSEDGWFSLGHDLWSSLGKDGVLGSCMKFIDKDMCEQTIATVLTKHNISHSGAEVAAALSKVYQERYNLNIEKEAVYVASDTSR